MRPCCSHASHNSEMKIVTISQNIPKELPLLGTNFLGTKVASQHLTELNTAEVISEQRFYEHHKILFCSDTLRMRPAPTQAIVLVCRKRDVRRFNSTYCANGRASKWSITRTFPYKRSISNIQPYGALVVIILLLWSVRYLADYWDLRSVSGSHATLGVCRTCT